MEDIQITNNVQETRFETDVDGHMAKLDYTLRGDVLQIDYVYVPSAIGGRGIGSQLVEAALAWGEKQGLQPYPVCGFARAYLERHPEYRRGSAL